MKNVYVVLPKSNTLISKISKMVTHYEYSHITISLDDNLNEFYSFSRIYNDAPIISGFVKEYRSHLASKKGVDLKCKIFKIEVSDDVYNDIKNYITDLKNDNKLLFNYLSMLLLPIVGGVKVIKSYNCCHFVAEVLNKIPKINMNKKLYKYKPKDFDLLLSDRFLYFEGVLKSNYKKYKGIYFNKVNFIYKIRCSFYFINEVIYRIIFKKVRKKFDNKKYIKLLLK